MKKHKFKRNDLVVCINNQGCEELLKLNETYVIAKLAGHATDFNGNRNTPAYILYNFKNGITVGGGDKFESRFISKIEYEFPNKLEKLINET